MENSSFQGVSEANLHTFLPRFSLRKFDCLWKALGMAKLPRKRELKKQPGSTATWLRRDSDQVRLFPLVYYIPTQPIVRSPWTFTIDVRSTVETGNSSLRDLHHASGRWQIRRVWGDSSISLPTLWSSQPHRIFSVVSPPSTLAAAVHNVGTGVINVNCSFNKIVPLIFLSAQ